MTQKTPSEDRKIKLLEIIGKYPGINHRELLRIIDKKQLMAKATAEKYLKELEQEKEVIPHRYGKEKQYFLSENNSTEQQLEEQFDIKLKQLKKKINEIETHYKKYDYVTKYRFVSYLDEMHDSLSRNLSNALRDTDIETMAAAYPRELVNEIREMTGKPKTQPDYKVRHLAYEIFERLQKISLEWVNHAYELRTIKVSQKRKEIQKKMKQIDKQELELIHELENLRDSLKSKEKC